MTDARLNGINPYVIDIMSNSHKDSVLAGKRRKV